MTSAPKPQLPANLLNVLRRIRRCESEVPAQLVLEHFALEYGTACAKWQQEKDAAIAHSFATCGCNGAHGRCNEDDLPKAIAAAIRLQAGQEGE